MKKIFKLFFVFAMLVTSFVANPSVKIIAEGNSEWTTENANVTTKIVDGVRYNELASIDTNDNGGNSAIFNRVEKWNIEGTEGSAALTFIPQADGDVTRFGVNILHSDMNNYITVGYDKIGWFWEYKSELGGAWLSGARTPAPKAGTVNTLELELKDNKIIAFLTVDEGARTQLFEKMIDANIVNALAEKSAGHDNIVARLGSYNGLDGMELSKVLVRSDDQTGIEAPVDPDPDPEPEPDPDGRPQLGEYEEYTYELDFEDIVEADLDSLLTANSSTVALSLVQHNESQALKIDFPSTRGVVTFDEIPLLDNYEIELEMTPSIAGKRLGIAGRVDGGTMIYAAVGDQPNSYFSEHYGASNAYSSNSAGPEIKANETKVWKQRLVETEISLEVDGTPVLKNSMGNMPTAAGELGIFKDRGVTSVIVDNVVIKRIPPKAPETPSEEGVDIKKLETDAMTVRVDADFPRVLDYTMGDKVMHGQASKLDTILINDFEIVPEVSSKVLGNEIEYTLKLKDETANVDAILTAEFVVRDNILEFNITNVENFNADQTTNAGIIRTIEIPNHSLVSVRSDNPVANIMGARMSTNTVRSGDTLTAVDAELKRFSQAYMYAFVSDSDLSAGLASNSQSSSKGDFNRVTAQATEYIDFNAVGLSSTQFIYHRDVKYPNITIDMPQVKVAITQDANKDGSVDWQDGAIAFRDIMHSPIGAEKVKDFVAYRIAMNFGSHAQNPFLMTLDNIKKVNLHTDGLGQSILLKGYGSEGHDSGHLNYADVGRRMGGLEEFKVLLEQSLDYGADIGIHVNASETYPESPYFTEDILRKNADGSYNYGWNWIDQGINIDASYDLANGRRTRWEDLKEAVGDNLGWIYVDVWGNGQSGDNGSWASHQLAKEIFDQGWRLGGEWGYAFEPDSTFQHWAADLTYGGYGLKGINSTVTRFIFNSQRDSWNANYPSYSGSADYPLLGGYNMKDFEGWQGRNDYDGYMTNLFENNVSTKFVQHFDVTKWVDGETVRMPNPAGGTLDWTPEMLIELEGDLGKLVIERKSNDYANDLENYRSRTMKLDGRLVLDGETYLLPWNWDENGEDLAAVDHKLYHFNKKGGSTTWEIPSDWDVSDVKFYQLTETGNKLIDTVEVVDGQITLTAEANKGYAVYKGAQAVKEVTYGLGAHIVDPHFNTQNLDAWNVTGDGASVVKSQASNDMLRILDNSQDTKVSQVLNDLTPGETYVAYVGIDNRSDAAARLTVEFDGFETSEFTNKSIAKNYIQAYGHNTNSSTVGGTSYFQNMFVYFTAPAAGTEVTLTLSRDAGKGASYFDDIRITENKGNPHIEDGVYFQDFEESAQGIAPFVVGNIEGVQDNRTHLSEKNAPYTQRGWNNKQISDVLEGDWSLKTNGLVQRNRLVYQTIPQNVRFEAGVTYKVSFDYEAGSEGTYAVVIGDGEVTGMETKDPLKATLNKDKYQTYEVEITGAASGQTWFGIWSTQTAADLGDSLDKDANFRSYKDVMLDNIRVEKVKEDTEEVNTTELSALITKAEAINPDEFTEATVAELNSVLAASKDLLTKTGLTQAEVNEQVLKLQAALDALEEKINLDTSSLDMAISLAESKVKDDYTATSFANLENVLAGVKENYDNYETQAAIDAATASLEAAILGLELKEEVPAVDTSVLETALEAAENLDLEGYTDESVARLKSEISKTKALLGNKEASQEEINAQVKTLQAAYNGLVEVEPEIPAEGTVDTKKLDALIDSVEKSDLMGYTDESTSNLNKVLRESKALLKKEGVTQAELDAQVDKLQTALNKLEKIEMVTPVTPVTPQAPKDDLPATGMSTSLVLPGLGISTALAGVYLVLKKRNEK